ncbi:MAG: PAS-domain containing protein [Sphingomonadales bacterium]|nr:PAS-domain containing protein [Sphingomonadales bacterium]
MTLTQATAIALGFVLCLFAVAALVEGRSGRRLVERARLRHAAYTLALGVYCTSWTFYGAVGSAVREGWNYLAIYLAPVLLLLLAPRFLMRLAEAVAEEGASTASDFIAARFSHDAPLARLVTVTALAGSVPYIALQLRSIGNALAIVSAQRVELPAMVAAAALLALFAMLFGARRYELAGRSEGLLYAISLDSVMKLAALALVAGFAAWLLVNAAPGDAAQGWAELAGRFRPQQLTLEFAVIALISAGAVIVLPRQFYMGLVEARAPSDLPRARFGLAAYIAAMALLVLPIAAAGLALPGTDARPDLFVLQLPLAAGSWWFLAVALLGGVGAAASMAIVDATALATMVSNDLLSGAIIARAATGAPGAIGARMLAARRLSILAIMAAALAWAELVPSSQSLASIGLVAFAAMAQFTPMLVLAVYGRGRDPVSARIGLIAGLALWAWTLALPPVLPPGWRDVLAGTVIDPLRLFGIGKAPPLVHGVGWSLGVNLALHALFAARNVPRDQLPSLVRGSRHINNLGDLSALVAGFVGQQRAAAEFPTARRADPVDRRAILRARSLIGTVVGASSARTLMASALAGGQMDVSAVTRLLGEGGQSLRFSRQLLAATFENIDAGICVIDGEQNLVAWNSRYEELLRFPSGMVRLGVPIVELISLLARRGDYGAGDPDALVATRIGHLRGGRAYDHERRRLDGTVLKTTGGPMPGGGYVMSFLDVTAEVRARDELERTLAELEARVAARTHDLSEANRRLAEADRDKTRFLAAASHDLLQPLHAARLFTAALKREVRPEGAPLAARVDSAIVAAEDLLRALLDISKLDAGGIVPHPEPVVLARFLGELVASLQPMAAARGLVLRLGHAPGSVHTDPGLLRSLVQNFLTNALRYTEHGGVVVGVRRRGDMLRIDVVDSGVGIAPEQIDSVFGEFTRLGQVEAEGLGLGLALANRLARLLGAEIEVSSRPGHGSRFSLVLPALADAGHALAAAPAQPAGHAVLDVLVVDDDPRVVEATVAMLQAEGHRAHAAADIASALPFSRRVDAVLADYRLAGGEDGLSLIAAMRAEMPGLPAVLITAEATSDVRAKAAALAVQVLAKPAAPDAIAAFLARASVPQVQP